MLGQMRPRWKSWGAQFKQGRKTWLLGSLQQESGTLVSSRVTGIDERWRDKFLLAEDTINSYKLGPPRYFNSLSSRAVSLANNIYPILTRLEIINVAEIFPLTTCQCSSSKSGQNFPGL